MKNQKYIAHFWTKVQKYIFCLDIISLNAEKTCKGQGACGKGLDIYCLGHRCGKVPCCIPSKQAFLLRRKVSRLEKSLETQKIVLKALRNNLIFNKKRSATLVSKISFVKNEVKEKHERNKVLILENDNLEYQLEKRTKMRKGWQVVLFVQNQSLHSGPAAM